MEKRKMVFGVIGFLLIIAGCVTEFNADLPSHLEEEFLVLEGNIIANTTCEFVLSKTFSINEDKIPENYNDVTAKMIIIGDDGYRSQPAVYVGNGIHKIDVGELNDDIQYGIEFEYENDTYRSELSKPLQTPDIDSVSWRQPERDGNISIYVSTHDNDTEVGYYIWEYEEDWEYHPRYPQSKFLDPATLTYYFDETLPVYNCWRKRSGNEILIGNTEAVTENRIIDQRLLEYDASDERFMELYSILVKQRAMSKEAHEYYSIKLKQNDEMGGLFTPQPSELKGNILCISDPLKTVIGYVDVVKNITESRMFIPYSKITRIPIYPNCYTASKEYMDMNGISSFEELYLIWNFRPITGELGDFWVEIKCADCTAMGGTKNKPDFWPNSHQ